MKRLSIMAGLILAVTIAGPGYAEMREFATKDGTVIYGEVQSYSLDTDKVQFKTDRGKSVSIKAETLLDEDFVYVRDWDAVRKFSQNTDFRIYLSEAESLNKWAKFLWHHNPGKVEPNKTHEIFFNRMAYEIKFDNQTGYDLENVDLEYCIFYMQERIDHKIEEKVTDLVVRPSIRKFSIIPEGQNKKFFSDSVVLRRKEIQGQTRFRYLEGEGRRIRSELVGIIFRATMQTASGLSAVRELRLPKDLSEECVWVEPTPENTVWPDDDLDESEDTQKPPTQFELEGGVEGEDEE